MRKWIAFALVVAVAAVLAGSGSALNRPVVFSVLDAPPQVDQQMGSFNFENPPVGGDQFGFHHTLYRWAGTKKGARIGHLQVVITFVTGFGPTYTLPAQILVDAQASLPGGTIMVVGYGRLAANGPSRLTLPVVGGTGTYSNARGYVKVRDLGNGNISKTNLEFHLKP